MASVKFEKGSREWYMFQEYWKLCQKFWIPETYNKYWDDMVKESKEFGEKYEDVKLSKMLMLALIECLEDISKNEKQTNTNGNR